jgi:hypothetical protein
MADAVASQTLFDGMQKAVMKFTNISDGTGETKVTKVDPSALNANNVGKPCTRVTITKIHATTHGMEVLMYWDATTDVFITSVPQNTNYSMDLTGFGGFWNNAGTGITGSIQFSTADASAGDVYTITLEMIKTYG